MADIIDKKVLFGEIKKHNEEERAIAEELGINIYEAAEGFHEFTITDDDIVKALLDLGEDG